MNTEQHTPNTSALEFLTTVFEPEGEILTGGRIAVWNKSSHSTRLAETPEEAVAISNEPSWRNVSYFGICTRDAAALRLRARTLGKPITALQGERKELLAMPGLWVDIDCVAPGHQKQNLAPTVTDCLEVLARAVPITPTIVVRTGGGIHAYWLFSEGLIDFALPGHERSREDLETLCRSFQAMVRDELHKDGWAEDMTHPIPRVMRLPGGTNNAHGKSRPVTWELTGPRCSIDDLREVIPSDLKLELEAARSAEAASKDWTPEQIAHHDERIRFEIHDLDVAALEEHASLACEEDEDFAAVWNMKRKDLPSLSEHDMSLANQLVASGTPTQQIVDLLRYHRRIHTPVDAPKEKQEREFRSDLYVRTLTAAFVTHDQNARKQHVVDSLQKLDMRVKRTKVAVEAEAAHVEALESQGDAVPPAAAAQLEAAQIEAQTVAKQRDELRATAMLAVNESLALNDPTTWIVRIIRSPSLTSSTEVWQFTFANGEVREITLSKMSNYYALRDAVMSVVQEIVEPFTTKAGKPRQWSTMLKLIMAASGDDGLGTEIAQARLSVLRLAAAVLGSNEEGVTKPKTPAWYGQVSTGRVVVLYEPGANSARRPGVLVHAGRAIEHLQLDPNMTGNPAQARSLLRGVTSTTPGMFRDYVVNVVRSDGRRATKRGYLLIEMGVFEEHMPSEAGAIERARRNAKAE